MNSYKDCSLRELEPDRCGLWWILSTVTAGIFAGVAFGIFLWLVLS